MRKGKCMKILVGNVNWKRLKAYVRERIIS